MMENIKAFENGAACPGADWRGAPFWALNGELSPEEMRRQVRGFHECGLGSFFLHARTGLSTPYLSERWFECLAAAIDEAEKLGMKAWLYDEDRFPSGSGGGLVTMHAKYRAKGIFLERRDNTSAQLPPNTLATFAARFSEDGIENYRPLENDQPLQQDEELLVFYTDTIACSSWYNNYTYLDTINKEAVEYFIEVTHEAYYRHFGNKFGKTIAGIFTDEPRYGFLINQPSWDVDKRLALPWTPGLLEQFNERFGYDVTLRLPELFFEVKGVDARSSRIQYVSLLQELFLSAFAKPIYEWCHKHNLLFTGHVVGEDALSYQTLGVGSAMRFYEYMDMPGMDLLTEHHRAYVTAKQLASAARQLGKKRRLCECYGCTGWAFPPIGFQAIGDWLAALGVTFRCQHLAFYTMAGEAKRDYPCPVALQSNAPSAYKANEERAARIAKWLSYGHEERSLLVISPIESAWALFHNSWRKEARTKQFDVAFNNLAHFLLAQQMDFDFGDEGIMAAHASVANGKLRIGEAEYNAVLLPQLITIRQSTLGLLLEFKKQGGTVISLSDAPQMVDALPSSPEWPFAKCDTLEELPILLEELCNEGPVCLQHCPQLLFHWRQGEEASLLFACNTGHPIDDQTQADGAGYREISVVERTDTVAEVTIKFPCAMNEQIAELDLETGKLETLPTMKSNGFATLQTSFDRLQSRLFVVCDATLNLPLKQAIREYAVKESLQVTWNEIRLSEENVMVLDHFTTKSSEKCTYVLELDDICRQACGLPTRGLLMAQPWCRSYDEDKYTDVCLRRNFDCKTVPAGESYLVIEHPELYICRINGKALPLRDCGFWHQPAWRKCPLPSNCLQAGDNVIELQTRINARHPGLESAFLLGNFSVTESIQGDLCISAPAMQLEAGDWCSQGLSFYGGDVLYKCQVKLPRPCKARISLRAFSGLPAVVSAGGHSCVLQLSPGTTPVWDLPENFSLDIRITGSLRNACGPFWQEDIQPKWCGPDQFKSRKVEHRRLMPYGLLVLPEIQIIE